MATTVQGILSLIYTRISHLTETPSQDAQVLAAHFLKKPRSWVMAHPEAQIDDHRASEIIQGLTRLEHGEPLPYVIGHWEFYGFDFNLTPHVLIPRPETELLVETGLDWLLSHPGKRRAIDVGTGSGCIGISLALKVPDLHVLMTDVSPLALQVAQINMDKFGLAARLECRLADLLEGIVELYDLICANLPYIPGKTLKHLAVAEKEPRLALDGGLHGTKLIFKLLEQARKCLAPGGVILLEIESSQAAEIEHQASSLFPAAQVAVLKDLAGDDRCIKISASNLLVHLCQLKEWQSALESGALTSNSLVEHGFIHCSQPQQILQVANRFYRDIPELVLLWLDPDRITSKIMWESADGSLFPHVYGPIHLDAVLAVTQFRPDRDGCFRIIECPV
jgi:release factor glutamine methyltransferase